MFPKAKTKTRANGERDGFWKQASDHTQEKKVSTAY